MDFSREIVGFVTDKIGGIVVVLNETGAVAYADRFFTEKYGSDIVGAQAEDVLGWVGDCPQLTLGEAAVEWESIDAADKKYYKLNSCLFEKEERLYTIHQLTDITEYMSLNRDITKYMSFLKKLSGFQSAILENLSNSYQELLPMMTDYFKTGKAYFLIQRGMYMEIVTYAKKGKCFSNDRIVMTQDMAALFENTCEEDIAMSAFAGQVQDVLQRGGDAVESCYCLLCSGSVSEQKYAIYLLEEDKMDKASLAEKALVSVISIYAENALMREKLIYENEHDHLTGLYNKGKYLERIEKEYPNLDAIAIFNFDVNNLKMMNDKFGHEAGDKLIIKAADSIRKVTGSNVHGYRMGGDEFLMVACNVTQEEADTLKMRWEEELARLNTIEDGINCVIAVGMVFSKKPYDLSSLLSRADELMYEDKKAKKKPGEEIR